MGADRQEQELCAVNDMQIYLDPKTLRTQGPLGYKTIHIQAELLFQGTHQSSWTIVQSWHPFLMVSVQQI